MLEWQQHPTAKGGESHSKNKRSPLKPGSAELTPQINTDCAGHRHRRRRCIRDDHRHRQRDALPWAWLH